MIAARRFSLSAIFCAVAATALSASADTTTYEDVDGIRYQVTRRSMQVGIPQPTTQQQTVMRQQVSTQTLQHQQLYTVPVTQYQLVSTLHGRWNPFVTPYWTHQYQPVTTWQQQTATVQIPVNSVAWVPETRSVPGSTMTYRTVDAIVSRIPIGAAPAAGTSQQMMASTGATTSTPSATLAARPGTTTSVPSVAAAPAPTAYGQMLQSDPPKQATGWQTPTPDTRYGDAMRR